jgi:hypothetical protein
VGDLRESPALRIIRLLPGSGGGDRLRVVREAPLVVDFRGVTRGIEAPNLVRL